LFNQLYIFIMLTIKKPVYLCFLLVFVLLGHSCLIPSDANTNINSIEQKTITARVSYVSSEFNHCFAENIFSKYSFKFWASGMFSSEEEGFVLSFSDEFYVHKIQIIETNTSNFRKIERVTAFTNNDKIGEFTAEKYIPVNRKIDNIKLFFSSQKLNFVYALDSAGVFGIAKLQNILPLSISEIVFFENDSTIINFNYSQNKNISIEKNKSTANGILKNVLDRKIIYKEEFSLGNNIILKTLMFYSNATFLYSEKEIDKSKKLIVSEYLVKGNYDIMVNNKNYAKLKIHGEYLYNTSTTNLGHFVDIIEINNFEIRGNEISRIVYKLKPSDLVELSSISNDFEFDIRYAGENNFTKQVLYDCPKCFLRFSVAHDLIMANREFMQLGYRLKIFDCYRPLSVQRKMWEIVPNPNYVANPEKGSIHNRGGAVDLSLVNFRGKDVEMGTDFDFFGYEAFHEYPYLHDSILSNRGTLKNILAKHNFMAIRTEWWHYSHRTSMLYPVMDFRFVCD
jgi:zinc D-Ala-D-Ala dipeptidase